MTRPPPPNSGQLGALHAWLTCGHGLFHRVPEPALEKTFEQVLHDAMVQKAPPLRVFVVLRAVRLHSDPH